MNAVIKARRVAVATVLASVVLAGVVGLSVAGFAGVVMAGIIGPMGIAGSLARYDEAIARIRTERATWAPRRCYCCAGTGVQAGGTPCERA